MGSGRCGCGWGVHLVTFGIFFFHTFFLFFFHVLFIVILDGDWDCIAWDGLWTYSPYGRTDGRTVRTIHTYMHTWASIMK